MLRDQTAAVTGRISSSNPNLQAIPKTFNLVLFPRDGADPVPLRFRSVYQGRAGWRLVAADFKQVECRVLAHAARDEHLEQALRSDDLFTDLAARWLEKPGREVSGRDRERTKRLVYAGLYGAGARTLADILQLPQGQLEEVIHSFDRTFPSLKRFCEGVWSECSRDGGRVSTVGRRTRTFPNISSDDAAMRAQARRQAVNFIIQGSAAELCKRAMCECVAGLRRAGVAGRLLLAVHDELVWEVAADEVPRAADIIKWSMESCGRQLGLQVPLPVALYTGHSWGDLEEYTSGVASVLTFTTEAIKTNK
ncbi:DNA polymerase nu like protein [Danaus plexippus plexippus]|uniref:DNA polymerase nu like protein n=1 Tax=Danaus plexippus plexippus TaxID=278856 RepID=A0A212FF85_DANPL|nr:DNA polymerase nu like protein [Danaus plexippus plexippus]